jgi:hypothetical protein
VTSIDTPTRILARVYYVIWVATIGLLLSAGVLHGIGPLFGSKTAVSVVIPELLVQGYLILLPVGILVFSVLMVVKKERRLALTGFLLTLIWVAARILG